MKHKFTVLLRAKYKATERDGDDDRDLPCRNKKSAEHCPLLFGQTASLIRVPKTTAENRISVERLLYIAQEQKLKS
jgi:hypothetical protein